MLSTLKVKSVDELMSQTIPSFIRLNSEQLKNSEISLGNPLSEQSALEYIKIIGSKNLELDTYIGCGFHPTFVPSVILRNITENPGWYTAYTPYQAEISQGRLESLLNFQTLVSELTSLPWSNASLLDEATAAAEAMYLAVGSHRGKRNDFFISKDTFPFIKEVIKTRANLIGVNVILF